MGDHVNGESNGRQVRAESHDSQTAKEFIDSQLQLEADAREALPYAFDHCTQPLGPLRQNLYSCLTCSPPPKSASDSYTPAGVCYSCSIACHGEHELVELFNRRNFTCDCGTTRLPATSPCTLRLDPTTGVKGPVHSQPAAQGNTYNKNFKNRFCGCGELYDAHAEKGTMFQCLGLAGEDDGGCGEDWWHPECILGLGRGWNCERNTGLLTVMDDRSNGITTGSRGDDEDNENHDDLPPGFPREDEFETFICYKCVGANPWIRRYAGSAGFLPSVAKSTALLDWADLYHAAGERTEEESGNGLQPSRGNVGLLSNEDEKTKTPLPSEGAQSTTTGSHIGSDPRSVLSSGSLKRKAEEQDADSLASATSKKSKVESTKDCYYDSLPDTRSGSISLFLKEDFRDHFCRCAKCYLDLRKHPQLLEEEESYEPPISESDDVDGGSVGTGSLLDRGEAALNNVDRVRAIEGVMVYNHLKDKVKSFLQPFAESGQAVGAEDIKAYFEKLRGDEQAIKAAATTGASGPEDDSRREQSGY
ncbi:MAG: hypothetical protein LQ341_005874 [Variospora aurantia]|nr:MAG: hypothetical protein LQ341_005874 [Variospora aurantia]